MPLDSAGPLCLLFSVLSCNNSSLPNIQMLLCMCVCFFHQDAAGEEFKGAAVFFCDSVGAGGHPAVRSAQQSHSSDRHLQNRGEANTGQLDTPCFAGNTSQGFEGRNSGLLNTP